MFFLHYIRYSLINFKFYIISEAPGTNENFISPVEEEIDEALLNPEKVITVQKDVVSEFNNNLHDSINKRSEIQEQLKYRLSPLSTINDFYNLHLNDRLLYLSKNGIDGTKILDGSVKNIEFDLDSFITLSSSIQEHITLGECLPARITKVKHAGKVYERTGVMGDFYHENQMLDLEDGLQISIEGLDTLEHTTQKFKEINEKVANVLIEQPELNNPDYREILYESLLRGLSLDKSIHIINVDYDAIKSLHEDEKFMTVAIFLKEGGYLDGVPESEKLEDFIDKQEAEFLKSEVNAQGTSHIKNGESSGSDQGEIISETTNLSKIVKLAKSQVGTREAAASKYFKDIGYNYSAKRTPWCGAFTSWVINTSGASNFKSLSSRAFIGQSGKGHVGIKSADNMVVSGNRGNKVSESSIGSMKPILGYAIPGENGLNMKPGRISARKFKDLPDGAIIVFAR